jgi:hypothetical protein
LPDHGQQILNAPTPNPYRKLSPTELAVGTVYAVRRTPSKRMTESISRSEAPDRINGATEVGKSTPPASPQAATVPPSACHRQNSGEHARAGGVDTVSPARIYQWFRGSGALLASQ